MRKSIFIILAFSVSINLFGMTEDSQRIVSLKNISVLETARHISEWSGSNFIIDDAIKDDKINFSYPETMAMENVVKEFKNILADLNYSVEQKGNRIRIRRPQLPSRLVADTNGIK